MLFSLNIPSLEMSGPFELCSLRRPAGARVAGGGQSSRSPPKATMKADSLYSGPPGSGATALPCSRRHGRHEEVQFQLLLKIGRSKP